MAVRREAVGLESACNCCCGFFNAQIESVDSVSLAVRLYERLGFESVTFDAD